MRTSRLTWAAAPLAALLLASGCGDDSGSATTTTAAEGSGEESLAGSTITLYSGRDEALIAPLIEDFEAATGVDVEVRYGKSAEMAAALLEEGDRTNADVFYSQEVGAVGEVARAGLLAELPDGVVELVDERFRPAEGNHWVGVTGRSRVIVYNPDLVTEIPKGVLDLTDPQYKGQVAWVPGNAGFQAFMTAFRVSQGEDAAEQWLEDMIANEPVTFEGNNDVLKAVDAGDVPMGLINHYYWGRLAIERGGADKLTAQLIFPKGDDPGALVNATAVGITKKAGDNAAALALVEYLLSKEGQTKFVEETSEYPLIDGVEGPAGFPPLSELEGPKLDLTDLDSLAATQALLTKMGLLS
ncbi:MAG: iron ABC transporter substrate-binding protein [Actinobacteria bacterium]|nr:iron ABC transporter substrate-binding protein [Actinomycetota bacterium]